MILKTLTLENIRSYTRETIEFPGGTTLFEGDIGSGKSTILMAIEFALFGLGSERGGALLRKGEPKGSVSLTFSVDDKDYTVTRRIVSRSRGSVQQDKEGMLETPEGTYHLSATELKERVLQILGFNEPADPKAQSFVYRYAIFTPQDEMKGIIFAPSDSRLQTLRKALRIEDYKVAATNAGLVQTAVKRKETELQAAASDLETIQENIKCKKGEIEKHIKELSVAREQQGTEEKDLNALRESIKEYQNQQVQLREISARIGPLEKQLQDKTKLLQQYNSEIQRLENRKREITPFVDSFRQKEIPTEKTVEDIRAEIIELEEDDKRLRRVSTQIESKIDDYRSVETEGVCPTCDRPADAEEFEAKIAEKLDEQLKAGKQVASCTDTLKTAGKLLQSLQKYEIERVKFLQLEPELERLVQEIKTYCDRVGETQNQIQEIGKTLGTYREESAKLVDVLHNIADLDKKINMADHVLQGTRANVVSLTTTIGGLNRSIMEDSDRVKLKLDQTSRANRLREYETWLDSFFIPTVNLIEKHVLTNANQDFNQHFQKWFSLLVEDAGKEARIDETFTPIVEQDGYEQDVHYLSGGEKTSIALAYRLALNTLVQRASTSMKSNLLILDEPTDGFSKEQLSRVKDILTELECPQVIIVSHERELESFADQIYGVTKTEGISAVRKRGV